MNAADLTVPASSIVHHLREAISDLADAVESLELTVDGIQDSLGPLPAEADAKELRKASNTAQAAADRITSLALEIARVGGTFEAVSRIRSAAEDAADNR